MNWDEGIKILWKDALRKGMAIEIPVNGNSMFPLLRDGDLVRVEIPKDKKWKTGEIVLFESSGRLILHRIISMQGRQSVVCRGDFTYEKDAPVSVDSILGKITGRLRNNKFRSITSCRFFIYGWLILHIRPFILLCLRLWKKLLY